MSKVTVLLAYRVGTRGILEACLRSFYRHTSKDLASIWILHDSRQELDVLDLVQEFGIQTFACAVDEQLRGSFIHGTMLDQVVGLVKSEYTLTLDSDCFPVADGWLEELIGMVEKSGGCAGILYPWQPIPDGVKKGNIDRRIREKHCWNNTHVACQLTTTKFLHDNKISYMADDDTGFAVPGTCHKLGLKVEGYKLTRCGLPNLGIEFDPEFNRHMSVIFGDKVYHHGGATQTVTGYKIDKDSMFSDVQGKVVLEKGAEWMLEDGKSHVFLLDKEEEVVDYKMQNMYREMVEFLKYNDRLFNS